MYLQCCTLTCVEARAEQHVRCAKSALLVLPHRLVGRLPCQSSMHLIPAACFDEHTLTAQPLRFMGPAHVVPLPPSRVPTPERTTADLSNAIPRDCAEPFSVAREEPPPALVVASGTSNLSRPLMQ